MRYEIENGDYVGSVEWRGPGQVLLDMDDPDDHTWFARYFSTEDTFLSGPVEAPEMQSERRDDSEEAFTRAAMRLAAYAYRVTRGDGRRWANHPAGRST